MRVKTLDISEVWVDRLVGLVDGSWTAPDLCAAFAAWGWPSDEVPEWGAGASAPYFQRDPDEGLGLWLELGPAPPDRYAAVTLPCALCWPAFGEEPEPGDEDDIDGDYGSEWRRVPGSDRATFEAERDRLQSLISMRLGAPEAAAAGVDGTFTATWPRGPRIVALIIRDDVNSYSHYDVLAITVCTADAGPPPG